MWLMAEGNAHVAAYLHDLDLRAFNPAAPPVKTDAFWSIVNANRSPTDSNVGDLVAGLTARRGGPPPILTLNDLKEYAADNYMNDVHEWLSDVKHRRQIPAALERAGYVEVANMDATDRRWTLHGRKQAIYRHVDISYRDAVAAIEARGKAKPAATRSERAAEILKFTPKP